MSDVVVLVLVGVLGMLSAFVERRDGWRFASLAERLNHEVADLRERVARLEERGHQQAEQHEAAPMVGVLEATVIRSTAAKARET